MPISRAANSPPTTTSSHSQNQMNMEHVQHTALLTRSIQYASKLRNLTTPQIDSALALHTSPQRLYSRRSTLRHVFDCFLDPRIRIKHTIHIDRLLQSYCDASKIDGKAVESLLTIGSFDLIWFAIGCLRSSIGRISVVGSKCPPSSDCQIRFLCSGV